LEEQRPILKGRIDIMSQGRVLIVDDEVEVRRSVRLILVKAGYDVDEAGDPESGVDMVKSGHNPVPLSAIVTDLNMPKINESIVVPYLRSQFPSCPVIVLSGSPKLEKASNMFKKAGVEFLVKPIDQEQLLFTLKEAIKDAKSKEKVST
jgi:DNA-binding NtrC family response regulator